jgi:hypothetical protein
MEVDNLPCCSPKYPLKPLHFRDFAITILRPHTQG